MRKKRDMRYAVVLLGIACGADVAGATDLDSSPPPAGRQVQIVVVGTIADHGLVGRVAAELRALKMDDDLRIVESEARSLGDEIDLALKSGARAIVHPDSELGRVDMLFTDPVTRRVTLRMSLYGPPLPALEPVLAVRAVEFVRAMLLGAPLVLPTSSSQAPVVEPASRWAGAAVISSGAAWAQGGLPAQGELALQLRVASPRSLGFSLLVLAPLTSAPVQGTAATNASVSIWLVGGDLFFRRAIGRRMSLDVGIGGLAIAMRVIGDPSTGWTGGGATGLGLGGYGHFGGSLNVTRLLAARVDIVAGGTLRRPVASAGGPSVYPWGYPFATAVAGIEVRLF
jgi:hypothetical protein